MPYLIIIAGGSGSGKSTLAYSIKKKYPDLIEVIHFDDYQKGEEDVPMFYGMRNWDHPEAIYFDSLIKDIIMLKNDGDVEIFTKSSIVNPEYEAKGRIPHTMMSKKILILEGYLALYNEAVRDMADLKIYLDLNLKTGIKRRKKVTYYDESDYNSLILEPMHEKYVKPSSKYADIIINVKENDAGYIQNKIINILKEKKLI